MSGPIGNLLDAHVFMSVARTRSMTVAARELGMSKETISRHVAATERRLGVPLFRRAAREVVLTQAGSRWFERCQEILEHVSGAVAEIGAIADRAPRILCVAAPGAFAEHFIVPHLESFLVEHPGTDVHLMIDVRKSNAVGSGPDICVSIDNAPPPRSHAVAPWPRILCAAPGYVERWGAPAAPHSLNAHRIAVDETVHDGAVWRLSATAETVEFHVTPRLRCEGDEVLRCALTTGLGIGLVHPRLVAEELATGRLLRVLDGFADETARVHVTRRERVPPWPETEALTRHLVGALRRDLEPTNGSRLN